MKTQNFLKADQKFISPNYPYGFRERTEKTDWLEFNPKKGFRHCSQTVNPKTGRLNNPKKSTYYTGMIMYLDENNYCQWTGFDFNGEKNMQWSFDFLHKNWSYYTPEMMEYFYMEAFTFMKVHTKAMMIYSGAKFDDMKPLIDEGVKMIVDGIKSKGTVNYWGEILKSIDWVKLDQCRDKDFQPFVQTEYVRIV